MDSQWISQTRETDCIQIAGAVERGEASQLAAHGMLSPQPGPLLFSLEESQTPLYEVFL